MTKYKLLLFVLVIGGVPCLAAAQDSASPAQTLVNDINNITSAVDAATAAPPQPADGVVAVDGSAPSAQAAGHEQQSQEPSSPQPAPPSGEVASAPQASVAQSNPDNILNPQTDIEKSLSAQLTYLNPQINVNNMPSLFFSRWEHDLISDARLGLTSSGPVPVAIDGSDPGVRDVSLAGIVYRSSSDWTVWLNSVRVTPDAIPPEVIDIKVYKEYIELEWFDRSKNLIYPIKLRAHQRFNLDTRMFLPG